MRVIIIDMIHTKIFHRITLYPSSGGIGSRLNKAKTLFTYATTCRKYFVCGISSLIIREMIEINIFTEGPARDINPS